VSIKLIEKLYADLYKFYKDDNSHKLDLDRLPDRTQFPNKLHEQGDLSVINLCEWKSSAAWILEQYDLYVLPYFPIPQHLTNHGDVDPVEVQQHHATSLEKLKAMEESDLIATLLGEKSVEGLDLYHAEELQALQAITNPMERALAYPGRGAGKRVYKGFKNPKGPSSNGFDFLVYCLKRQEPAPVSAVQEELTQEKVTATTKKAPKSKSKK
jgi:hypothetical protein